MDTKNNSRTITLESLTAAGRALFLCGLTGILVGLITGMGVGIFFFIVGAFYGGLWGMPVGFAAAILGAAIGGRRGCAIAGTLCGALGGATILGCGLGSGRPLSIASVASSGIFGLFAAMASGLGGFIAGTFVDPRLRPGAASGGLFHRLAITLEESRLYELPLLARLALAVVQIVPFFVLAGYIMPNGFGPMHWTD